MTSPDASTTALRGHDDGDERYSDVDLGERFDVSNVDPDWKRREGLLDPLLDEDFDSDPIPEGVVPRRRSRAAVQTTAPKKRKRTASTPHKRLVYSQEMNNVIMRLFMDCRRKGLIYHTIDKADFSRAWDKVARKMAERFPQFEGMWTREAVRNKHSREALRYVTWVEFLKMSGVGIDKKTGLPTASNETWDAFFSRPYIKSRNAGWLRTTPLGETEVYNEVFAEDDDDYEVGKYIAEPGEVLEEYSRQKRRRRTRISEQ